jgi:hypothetical protein
MSTPGLINKEIYMTFTFTEVYDDLDSSFVEAVYYNGLTKDAYVVLDPADGWGSNVYRYTSVPPEAVEALVNAYSIGSYYNTNFKSTYGPAGAIGKFYPQDFVKKAPLSIVGTSPSTVADTTKEFSLGPVFDPTVSGAPLADASTEPTKEFPLTLVDDTEDDDYDVDLNVEKTVVHFVLNGRKSKFVCSDNTVDIQSALDDFAGVAARLGLDFAEVTPTKVVFKFV